MAGKEGAQVERRVKFPRSRRERYLEESKWFLADAGDSTEQVSHKKSTKIEKMFTINLILKLSVL